MKQLFKLYEKIAPQFLHRFCLVARQKRIPRGKQKTAQQRPQHVTLSSKTPTWKKKFIENWFEQQRSLETRMNFHLSYTIFPQPNYISLAKKNNIWNWLIRFLNKTIFPIWGADVLKLIRVIIAFGFGSKFSGLVPVLGKPVISVIFWSENNEFLGTRSLQET